MVELNIDPFEKRRARPRPGLSGTDVLQGEPTQPNKGQRTRRWSEALNGLSCHLLEIGRNWRHG